MSPIVRLGWCTFYLKYIYLRLAGKLLDSVHRLLSDHYSRRKSGIANCILTKASISSNIVDIEPRLKSNKWMTSELDKKN